MPTPLLPSPTTILTSFFHSTPLPQLPLLFHSVGLISSFLSSLICCQVFFFSTSDHLPPSALFSFQPSANSVLSLIPWPASSPLGHLPSCIPPAWRSWGSFSMIRQRSKDPQSESHGLGLAILCLSPHPAASNSLWSPEIRKKIYWDHLSTEGMACEVLIDHLVVHSLTRWAQITQTALQAQRYKALQELNTACILSFWLSQLDTQECEQFRHSCLPVYTSKWCWRWNMSKILWNVQVITNKTLCLLKQTK